MNIYFFKTGFSPDYNGVYESIETYLATLTPTYTIPDYKTILPALEVKIKLPTAYYGKYAIDKLGDYARFGAPGDGASMPLTYWFVAGVAWKGKETAEITLKLDLLNTYWSGIKKHITANTHITRRYKKRFDVMGALSKAYAVVDPMPESLSGIPMRRVSTTVVAETNEKWYEVWKTENVDDSTKLAANPVSTILLPEKSTIIAPGVKVTWTAGDLPNGYWFGNSNPTEDINVVIVSSSGTETLKLKDLKYFGVYFYEAEGTGASFIWVNYNTTSKVVASIGFYGQCTMYWGFPTSFDDYKSGKGEYTDESFDPQWSYVPPFKVWYYQNKTNGRIVKIKELPYCPFDSSSLDSYGGINLPSQITNDKAYLLVGNMEFSDYKIGSVSMDLPYLEKSDVVDGEPDEGRETKLKNSSFRQIKLVYDTYSYVLTPEYKTDLVSSNVGINYIVSNEITDDIAFKFSPDTYDMADFGYYLVCSKNTDKPYYTNEYLNYLKYGKAIDERNLGYSVAGTALTSAASIGTSLIGYALGGAMGGASAGPVGLAIGAAVGVISAGITIATTVQTANWNIQDKCEQYKRQTSGVSSASSTSIFNFYGKNKLLKITYEPLPEFKTMIYNYFRLYGYATDEYGVPIWSTRKYCDYIQCSPVFEPGIWSEFQTEISSKMKEGIRIYHLVDNNYDLLMKKENWENSLIAWANSK